MKRRVASAGPLSEHNSAFDIRAVRDRIEKDQARGEATRLLGSLRPDAERGGGEAGPILPLAEKALLHDASTCVLTALLLRRKYLLWRCATACERLRCEPWRPWGWGGTTRGLRRPARRGVGGYSIVFDDVKHCLTSSNTSGEWP